MGENFLRLLFVPYEKKNPFQHKKVKTEESSCKLKENNSHCLVEPHGKLWRKIENQIKKASKWKLQDKIQPLWGVMMFTDSQGA